ncbi:MAG: CapA family protein [Oscillospiraceae bacterium]|nr:CapA family protein [Oscillospiraceae bacterium]
MKIKSRTGAVLLLLLLSVLLCSCKKKEPEPLPQGIATASLCAVGDIYLSENMMVDALTGHESYDFRPLFSQITPTISAADLAIGNFEGLFSSGTEAGYPDSLAQVLAQTGFDILQTANSYSVHNGISGLVRTKTVIEDNGMSPLGTYRSQEERKKAPVLIREVNGIRLAFIAFTKGFNGFGLPADSEYCTSLLYKDYDTHYEKVDQNSILSLVQAAKDTQPDFIIAALHWGSENISGISSTQETITDLLLENGVDVILGAHSHRVEKVERRTVLTPEGLEKECVIAYSLGDFCITDPQKTATSIVLNLEFSKDRATGICAISDLSYTPVSTVHATHNLDHYAIVPTREAVSLYENNYYLRVEEDDYTAMVSHLEKIEDTVFPTEPPTESESTDPAS